MSEWLNSIYAAVGLSIEIILLYYFFISFMKAKARLVHYVIFTASFFTFISFIQANETVYLAFTAGLLCASGLFFYRKPFHASMLYSIISLEIIQLCYGVSNSLSSILSPCLFPVSPIYAGSLLMTGGSLFTFGLAYLCFRLIKRHLLSFGEEQSQYILIMLLPLLLIFFVSQYISQDIYGNILVVDLRFTVLNANHIQMLLVQLLELFSLFCILYTYKKLVQSFHLSTSLALLKQETLLQKQYYERTVSFRHDVKNHLSVLKGLLEKENRKEAIDYLKDLETVTNSIILPCYTNNPVLDILIGNKFGLAEAEGISVSCSLKLPKPCGITNMDLCIMMSNALDNALHACKKLNTSARRYIHISGHQQSNLFLMEIENSYDGKHIPKKGVGLSNINSIAQKYQGTLHINCLDCRFCLSILLIIPQPEESISHQSY